MGAGGLMSGTFLAASLKVGMPGKSFGKFSRLVMKRHWVYGRWAAAARLPMRVPRIIIMSALPVWAGLEATGTLHALSNPIMPTVQVIGAISLLLIPTLSRARDTPKYFKIAGGMLGAFILATCLYWVLIGTFNKFVINLLYSGNYIESAGLLWFLGVQPVFTAAVSVLGAGFSAVEKPKYVFWAYMIGTIIGLPITLYLMSQYQLIGAIVGSIIMNLITTLVLCGFFVSLRMSFKRSVQEQVN
jgi:O-antigen/teichoic acid export membrane protein